MFLFVDCATVNKVFLILSYYGQVVFVLDLQNAFTHIVQAYLNSTGSAYAMTVTWNSYL